MFTSATRVVRSGVPRERLGHASEFDRGAGHRRDRGVLGEQIGADEPGRAGALSSNSSILDRASLLRSIAERSSTVEGIGSACPRMCRNSYPPGNRWRTACAQCTASDARRPLDHHDRRGVAGMPGQEPVQLGEFGLPSGETCDVERQLLRPDRRVAGPFLLVVRGEQIQMRHAQPRVRLCTELFGEQPTEPGVPGERLGTASRTRQNDDEALPQRFPECLTAR
jgi:hypothetical protein